MHDGTDPSARLVVPGAQAARKHSRAPPEHLGGSPWPQHPASGRPNVEDLPRSTTTGARRHHAAARTHLLHRTGEPPALIRQNTRPDPKPIPGPNPRRCSRGSSPRASCPRSSARRPTPCATPASPGPTRTTRTGPTRPSRARTRTRASRCAARCSRRTTTTVLSPGSKLKNWNKGVLGCDAFTSLRSLFGVCGKGFTFAAR